MVAHTHLLKFSDHVLHVIFYWHWLCWNAVKKLLTHLSQVWSRSSLQCKLGRIKLSNHFIFIILQSIVWGDWNRGSGQVGTKKQRWTSREWTTWHEEARVDIAGVDKAPRRNRCGQGRSERSWKIMYYWCNTYMLKNCSMFKLKIVLRYCCYFRQIITTTCQSLKNSVL